MPYCFPLAESARDLVERLRSNRWWGAIIGAHGSGKSTLLSQLLPALEQAGRRPVLIELHDGQRRLPRDWRGKVERPSPTAAATVVVDGYEQLSTWHRFWLKRYCRRRRLGLLVTSHLPVGLPEIYRTTASLQMAQKIVEQLLQNQKITIPAEIIAERFTRHGGNIRELLFDLYDLVEQSGSKQKDEG